MLDKFPSLIDCIEGASRYNFDPITLACRLHRCMEDGLAKAAADIEECRVIFDSHIVLIDRKG